MCTLYLIHFERAYKHAQHYLGSADDLEARITEHRSGRGARLLAVINQAGIAWSVARVWENASRKDESRLKKTNHRKRLCPACSPNAERRGKIKRKAKQ